MLIHGLHMRSVGSVQAYGHTPSVYLWCLIAWLVLYHVVLGVQLVLIQCIT